MFQPGGMADWMAVNFESSLFAVLCISITLASRWSKKEFDRAHYDDYVLKANENGEDAEYYQRMVVRISRIHGEQHEHAIQLNNLGLLLYHLDRLHESESYLKQALNLSEGEASIDYALRLNNYSLVLYSEGKYEEAMVWCHKSIDTFDSQIEDTDRLSQVDCQNASCILENLFNIYYELNMFDKALELHSRMILITNQLESNDCLELAKVYERFVDLVIKMPFNENAMNQSISYLKMLINIYKHTYKTKYHDSMAKAYYLWSNVLLTKQDNVNQAILMLRQAVSIYERLYGGNSATYIASINHLAGLLMSNPEPVRLNEAETLFKASLEYHQNEFGNNSSEVLIDLNNIVCALSDRGEISQAIEYQEQAIEISEALFTKNDANYLIDLNNYITLLLKRGKQEDIEIASWLTVERNAIQNSV